MTRGSARNESSAGIVTGQHRPTPTNNGRGRDPLAFPAPSDPLTICAFADSVLSHFMTGCACHLCTLECTCHRRVGKLVFFLRVLRFAPPYCLSKQKARCRVIDRFSGRTSRNKSMDQTRQSIIEKRRLVGAFQSPRGASTRMKVQISGMSRRQTGSNYHICSSNTLAESTSPENGWRWSVRPIPDRFGKQRGRPLRGTAATPS